MLLEVSDLSMHFGGLKAVSRVSFTLEDQEIVGLIGPNGAGKTTLFNTLSGYYIPTAGKIIFSGRDITRLKPPSSRCKLGLARTFQVVKPFYNLNVIENIMVGGFCRTNSTDQCREKALQVADLVGLGHRKDTEAKNLTIAERRRMELARAMATEPKIILLDEVMAGLTPTEVQDFLALLNRIRSEKSLTLLIIEHIMQAIMTIAERILVLHHGQLIADGSPKEIACDENVIEAYLGEEFQLA